MTLVFESVDRIKQIALPNVVGPHPSTEGLNRTKGLGKDNLPLCLTASQLGHQSSLPLTLDSDLNSHIDSPVSYAFSLALELYHQLSWVSNLSVADLKT